MTAFESRVEPLSQEKSNMGGQAVIEGVMMRNRSQVAIAVRQPEGSITVHNKAFLSFSERNRLFKLPILRGMVAFVEALILGLNAISFSAGEALAEDEAVLKGWELPLTMFFSLVGGIALFILLPTYLMMFLREAVEHPILLNLGEGFLRLFIFLSYVFLISRWQDVGRVFQYHGAEHKAIACFESGKPLSVENARPFSTLHRRCGTNFLLIVMVLSIIIFSFFGWPDLWQRILTRLMLLPLVAGLSYEVIRLVAAKDNWLTGIISLPGLWLQYLTTQQPADDQLEVAVVALKAVLPAETEA